tara:strand:- start:4230 stop:9620 length:5391 start_codon:yes stop_codon:yes gene_type:complete
MAVNKFPKVYHSGPLSSDNPYENVAYNIYTQNNQGLWNNDNGIDFYTFKDEPTGANADDSPETSYVLIVIKNDGEANSVMNLEEVSITSPAGLTGQYQPFQIVTNYNSVDTSSSITTGTQGLHTIPFADFPATINLDDGSGTSTTVNYGTGNSNYAALDPAPIGFVRLVTTSGAIEGSNTGDAEPFNDFGSSNAVRYVPFYNPADLVNANIGIGCTPTDYGVGTLNYNHYAAILIKCDPQIPLSIPYGDVFLNIVHSNTENINISLVMQAYNEGDISYQQGFLYNVGALDPTQSEDGAVDAGSHRFTPWTQYQTVTPNTSAQGQYDMPMVPSGAIDPFGNEDSAPGHDQSTTHGETFFLPPVPKTLVWNNRNNFLFNNTSSTGTNVSFSNSKFAVRIWDNTSYSGGVQWWLPYNDVTNQSYAKGVMNGSSHYSGNDSEINYVKLEQMFNQDYGAFHMKNDEIEADTMLQINVMTPSTSPFSPDYALQTLHANEFLYLILDLNQGQSNITNKFNTHRDYAGTPTLPNALDNLGNEWVSGRPQKYAFRQNLNLFPFYHKDYHIDGSTSPDTGNPICGPTQHETISILSSHYDVFGVGQVPTYKFVKANKTNTDGLFSSGQESISLSYFADYTTAFNSPNNNPNGDGGGNNFRARTHPANFAGTKFYAIYSSNAGYSFGANSWLGVNFDAAANAGLEGDAQGRIRAEEVVVTEVGNNNTNGGYTTIIKHMHINELVQIPQVEMQPIDNKKGYIRSRQNFGVAWTVFMPDTYTDSATNTDPFCSYFPWVANQANWNSNISTWYDGSETMAPSDTNRPIGKMNINNYYAVESNNISYGFMPNGFYRTVTGGDETKLNRSSFFASGVDDQGQAIGTDFGDPDGEPLQSTSIFDKDSSNWEDLTLNSLPYKQKALKLSTKLGGYYMNMSQAAAELVNPAGNADYQPGFQFHSMYNYILPGSINSYAAGAQYIPTVSTSQWEQQALNDDWHYSGDSIGRFVADTQFRFKTAALINYAKTRNEANEGNYDGTYGGANDFSLNLWGYQWPILPKGYTALNTSTSAGAGDNWLKVADPLYFTEWSCQTDKASLGGLTWSEGDVITEDHLTSLSQVPQLHGDSLSSGAHTVSTTGTASFYKFRIAPKTTLSPAYWKKLPFNGRTVFKHQRYFTDDKETAQSISISGTNPYTGQANSANDLYGICPGPRKTGRYAENGDWEHAWSYDNVMYEGTTRYNSTTNTHDCFIPINVSIDGNESDYSIQLVNIALENETLFPSGNMSDDGTTFGDDRNHPYVSDIAFGNPLYRWDRTNKRNLHSTNTNHFTVNNDNGTSSSTSSPEPMVRPCRVSNSDVYKFVHHTAVVDVNVNPQQNETHELHPIVRTAPISEITVRSITSIPANQMEISLQGGFIRTVKNNSQVDVNIADTDKFRVEDAGIRVGQFVYHVDATTGAKRTGTDASSPATFNAIPDGAYVTQINTNSITLSANTLNGTAITSATNLNLRFEMPSPNYAQWAISRGLRKPDEVNPSNMSSFPRNGIAHHKYSPLFILPCSDADNTTSGGLTRFGWEYAEANESWDANATSGDAWKYQIGAFSYMPVGNIGKSDMSDVNNALSQPSFDPTISYKFYGKSMWDNWVTYGEADGGDDTFTPGWMKFRKWFNTQDVPITAGTNPSALSVHGSPYKALGRPAGGVPHIMLALDNTKIQANKIEKGVFYNTLRVRYLLNNKLENFGLDHEIIGLTHYNTLDNDDNMINYAQGGAKHAQVYEDTFLVKINFDADVATLVVADLEADAQADNTSIDFGTLNSN